MTNESKTLKENIKSILIVVLFLSAILLLYFSWGDLGIKESLNPDQVEKKTIAASTVIEPSAILVSEGNDSYIAVCGVQGYFDMCINAISTILSGNNPSVESISMSEYNEAADSKGISLKFNYFIPFASFCDAHSLVKPSGVDNINAFNYLVYSESNPTSMYVRSSREEAYYKISCTYNEAEENLFNELIETAVTESTNDNAHFVPAYTLGVMLGINEGGSSIFPLYMESSMQKFEYAPEFSKGNIEDIDRFGKYFFGENLDFVRKIEESNGTITYMYGYGEKTLIASPNGVFEYKRENDGKEELKFSEALNTALSFIAEHGGFTNFDGQEYDAYLSNVVQNPDGKTGFHFDFSTKVNGENLVMEGAYPLSIEVINGKVTYFRRAFILYDELKEGEKVECYSALNTLAQNYEYIDSVLADRNKANKKSSLEDIAKSVETLSHAYVLKDGVAVPSWALKIGNLNFYFNLFNAEQLGYSEE